MYSGGQSLSTSATSVVRRGGPRSPSLAAEGILSLTPGRRRWQLT